MPAHDECRDDGLIATRRRAEEIDEGDLLFIASGIQRLFGEFGSVPMKA
jgi:hypothetical protein